MEISDLKIIVYNEIGKAEISNVLLVLREVLDISTDTFKDFTRERARFNNLKKDNMKGNMPFDSFLIERSKIVESLTELQNQIVEDDLVEGWASLPIIQSYLEEEDPQNGEEGIQDIALGEYSDIVLTQNAPSNGAIQELNEEDFEKLETLLIKTQDAIEVEAYDEAEVYCLEAKEIDKKSPQVYEYLALIYFKRMDSSDIIKGAINGSDSKKTLRHIFQYVRRFNQFSHRYRSDAINIARENIRTIGVLLTESLKEEYQKLKWDEKNLVWKCLGFYMEIYELLNQPMGFMDSAILELSGAGKVLWLRVEKDKIKNRYGRNFNALGLRKNFINKLIENYSNEENTEEEVIQKTEKRLANNFYYKIFRNYNSINPVRDSKGWSSWDDQQKKEIIQYLNASKVGYLLFESSDYLEPEIKQRFLETPFKELVGRGKPFLSWISLSNNGQLQTSKKISNLRYQAINELEFLAKKLNIDFKNLKIELKKSLFEKQLKYNQRLFDNVSKDMSQATVTDQEKAKAKVDLIKYMQRQFMLVRQEIGEVNEYLEPPLKELLGNGFFNEWIKVGLDGNLENDIDSAALKFDAVELLIKFLNCKKDYQYKFSTIDDAFFESFAKVNYNNYQTILKNNPVILPEDDSYQIIDIMKNLELTFLATGRPEFLKPVYDEISSNNWVFKENEEFKNQPNCKELGFDAVEYLERIHSIIQSIQSAQVQI